MLSEGIIHQYNYDDHDSETLQPKILLVDSTAQSA